MSHKFVNVFFKVSPFCFLWLNLPSPGSPMCRGHLLLLALSWACRWAHSKPPGWWGWRWWGWLLYQDVSSLLPVASSLRCVLLSDGSGTQPGLKRISMETWRPIYFIETVLQGHSQKECSHRITQMWHCPQKVEEHPRSSFMVICLFFYQVSRLCITKLFIFIQSE